MAKKNNINISGGIDVAAALNQDNQRIDGRKADEMRSVTITPNFITSSKGSVLIEMGNTRVICVASVDESVPGWMRYQNIDGGWLTAEYSMLPGATQDRTQRESAKGKLSGRTMEIQRLIGRSLRAVIDLKKLGRRQIYIDCDVIQADGGTRTASITGAFIAMKLAITRLIEDGILDENPITESLAAISVGIKNGVSILDLCYIEDSTAEVDANFVIASSGQIIEVQATAEGQSFSKSELNGMLELAEKGVNELFDQQQKIFNY